MSHISEVKFQINSILDLRQVVTRMGLQLVEDAIPRAYSMQPIAPYIIRCKGPYDVAVRAVAGKPGSFELSCDYWQGYVATELGKGCSKLISNYIEAQLQRQASRAGKRLHKTTHASGAVEFALEVEA